MAAVDPELKEAEKEGNQYYISMSLNAALSRPGFTGSTTHIDQVDSYMTNGNGNGSRAGSRMGPYPDDGRHASRLDVRDYDAQMPDRPGSRAVSILQVTGEPDHFLYNNSRSAISGYYGETMNTGGEEGYVVKSVTATKARPMSQMSYRHGSMDRLDTDEKVDFDLELLTQGGVQVGGRKIIRGVNGTAGGHPGGMGLGSYSFQATTTARHTTDFGAGPEPRFTMKLNDTLLMDYLPNESNGVVVEETRRSTGAAGRTRRKRPVKQPPKRRHAGIGREPRRRRDGAWNSLKRRD